MTNEGQAANEQIETVKVGAPRKRGNNRKPAKSRAKGAATPTIDLGDLQSVFGRIVAAEQGARDQITAQEALETFKEAIGDLSPEAFRILAADPMFQDKFEKVSVQAGTKPGDPVYDSNGRQIGNVPFSLQWCEANFPMVEYTPWRTNSVSWNGVEYHFRREQTVTCPKVFVDIEEQGRRAEENASAAQYNILAYGPSRAADGVELGTGWYKETPEELEERYGVEV